MHMREMLKEESSDARDYALIARELHSMDPASQLTVKPLFELQLEESTWGRLGPGIYTKTTRHVLPVEYIALEQCKGYVNLAVASSPCRPLLGEKSWE